MDLNTKAWRWVMFGLSASIALVATRFFFLSQTEAAGEEFGSHLARHGLWFYAHAGGGVVALMAGALQWLLLAQSRRSPWHRLIGRTYVAAIAVGGTSGVVVALRAFGGVVSRTGFFVLAVAWIVTTAWAFGRARARDWPDHRAWMTRSFALTFAAVTLRLWLPALQVAGVDFETAYRVVAWLSWVPNLLVAEWLIAHDRRDARVLAVPILTRS